MRYSSPATIACCGCVSSVNKSEEQINKEIEERKNNLTVDKRSLSSYTRTKISIYDDRPASVAIGSIGIVVMVIILRADVAFQAKLVRTIGSTMTAHTVVVFDNVAINVGNGYSTRTGKFTVPEEGIYVFHWTCMTHTNNVFRTELVVDGNIKVGNHAAANFPTDAHDTGSQMYTGRLTKNNQVWIRTFHTETYLRGHGWSAFSGYKL
ncbi:hypothetical protein FSP39_020923 [Pinctada imbricata]|uniref:C1q domain-containing protein n=1 Tax=Pinctada imbricata TaxID=66713 RepID=A0AA88Y8R3_PINIB|nr:hypothetical protein FSP39_020923 [Pinctada imbricata]